ncbi:hypothetical protein [Wolbachia endosymbiont (group A) of Colletes cunicularius]|uniref:hypothetical protein n=1 Tax=Wolbachia endosymbiont (group A) of Colletes cunicularius TaxID=3139321 RepID=UPI0035C8B84F
MEDITKLFCLVDDFCRDIEKNFADKLLPNGKNPTRTTEIEHWECSKKHTRQVKAQYSTI